MTRHISVLLREVLAALQLKSGENVVDCTLGDGGHSEAMLEQIAPNGKLLGIDADPESVLRAKQYLYRYNDRVIFARDNFENIKQIVAENNFHPVNAILLDLGWSTPQFKERGRGFSFEGDEPLDMRYGGANQKGMTAAEIINEYSFADLKRIFRQFGEEKLAEPIAQAIVDKRSESIIDTTGKLTEIILEVFRTILKTEKEVPWVGGLHPATKVYQALRIETNRELEVLKKVLADALEILEPGGRFAVITFHSLEDRIVKHFIQSRSEELKIINKKPIVATDQEVEHNPSSRSAKLRIIQKN